MAAFKTSTVYATLMGIRELERVARANFLESCTHGYDHNKAELWSRINNAKDIAEPWVESIMQQKKERSL